MAWTDSRVSPLFAHVAETRSDLKSEVGTLGVNLSYFTFLLGTPGNTWNATLGYAFSASREQYRGFTSTNGDPTTTGWSRGTQARHAITMNVGYRVERLGSANVFGRTVGAAVLPNGHRRHQWRRLLERPRVHLQSGDSRRHGPREPDRSPAQRVLIRRARVSLHQVGTIAGRNSCMGPWAFTNLSLQLTPDPYRFRLGNRGSMSLFVNNILSGVDQAIHGSNKLHGWGQAAIPDPTLLTVRGYDPATQKFKYAVNPQFGSTAVFRNTFRAPFMLTIDFRMDVAPDRESQFLGMLLAPRKADNMKVLPEATIKQRIMRGNNPVDQIMFVKDSLKLTDAQVESMRKLGQQFVTRRDSIAGAVAHFLAQRNGDYGGSVVRDVWHAAGVESYRTFLITMKGVAALFTPEQAAKAATVPQTAGFILQISDRQNAVHVRSPMNIFLEPSHLWRDRHDNCVLGRARRRRDRRQILPDGTGSCRWAPSSPFRFFLLSFFSFRCCCSISGNPTYRSCSLYRISAPIGAVSSRRSAAPGLAPALFGAVAP